MAQELAVNREWFASSGAGILRRPPLRRPGALVTQGPAHRFDARTVVLRNPSGDRPEALRASYRPRQRAPSRLVSRMKFVLPPTVNVPTVFVRSESLGRHH